MKKIIFTKTKLYSSPTFETIELQFEQNILGGSGDAGELGWIEELEDLIP
ncbi:MAG: hypothetical protein WC960_02870 [Bacteroidales bacterium]